MRTSPIIGYGYGKPIQNVTGMADVSGFDPLVMYLTHDQILWVWMRLGTIGFVVYWFMISNILIRASRTAADATYDTWSRATGVIVVGTIASLLIFGLYDLQLSNVRDELISSVWLGVLGVVLRQRAEQEETARLRRMTAVMRYTLAARHIGPPGYSYMPRRDRTAGGSAALVRVRRAVRQ
jgi:O-antigen ligase